jgi:alpha-L-fucosidase
MKFNDERDWFFEKKFGMFIHWGLYSIPAWHEQHQFRLGIPRQEYRKLMNKFNPDKFDPYMWIELARRAGMQYMTFTAKHQDGFCMWDTDYTNFKVTNSPYGKDVLEQLVQACHKEDFPLCLYYCQVDNHHFNYPNQGRGHELPMPEKGDDPCVEKYVEYIKNQAIELCTRYGKIHGFWWDVNDMEHQDGSINKIIRELQPGIIINDRGMSEGDFGTPERHWMDQYDKITAFEKPTEACESIGVESWGYRKNEDYHTVKYLQQRIDMFLSKGGNFLLNAGPKADGSFPSEAHEIFEKIGKWINKVGESFYQTEPASNLTDNKDVLLTRSNNTLYVHIPEVKSTGIVLNPVSALPNEAVLLNDGRRLKISIDYMPRFYKNSKGLLHIRGLPVFDYKDEVLVLKLTFDSKEAMRVQNAVSEVRL